MDKIAEIKKLYFSATRATITRDFDRAIDILKSIPDEQERERATVFMQGLAEMRKQWNAAKPPALAGGRNAERRRNRRL